MVERPDHQSPAPLITFRVSARPDDPQVWRLLAERLPDHRAAYLDYEGDVSANRGCVTRLASGSCLILRDDSDEFRAQMLDSPLRVWIGAPLTADGYSFHAE